MEHKRFAQKCPRQLLRSMLQFVLEEYLDIMCSEAGDEMGDFMILLARDEFISAMLRMHAADSSQKWLKIDDKNAKMDKSDLTL